MRKKALNKDTFREIKRSVSRFISIMLIISLGAGFFVGLKATAPSVFATAENYFNNQNLMDFEILSTAGFDDNDIKAIYEIDGVERVMPSYSVDLIMENENKNENGVVRVMSLPSDSKFDSVNDPELLEGRFPEKPNECVTTASDRIDNKYKIGDTIKFSDMTGTTETGSVLTDTVYKVVGIIKSPMYFSMYLGSSSVGSGTLISYAFIPAANFLYTRYTEVYLTLTCHKEGVSIFEDEYDKIIKNITEKLKATGVERYNIFIKELYVSIAEAEKELEDSSAEADNQVNKSKSELEDAKKKIDDGKAELAAGWEEYYVKSADAEKQIAGAQKKIDSIKAETADGEKALTESRRKYDDSVIQAEKELADVKAELDSSRKTLEESRTKTDEGWAEYYTGLEKYRTDADELKQKKTEYDTAVIKLDDGIAAYNDNVALYNEKYALYVQSLKDYGEAVKKYDSIFTDYKKGEVKAQKGRAEYEASFIEYSAELDKYNAGLKEYEASYKKYEADLVKYWAKSAELTEANSKYLDGLAKYNQGMTDYKSGLASLEAGKIKIAESKVQLAENKKLYADGLAQYTAEEADYNNNPALQTPELKAQLDAAKAELDASNTQIIAAEAQIATDEKEIAGNEAILAETKKTLDASKIGLDQAKVQIDDGVAQLAEGKKPIDAAKAELDAGKKERDDSKITIDASTKKIEEAKRQFDEGEAIFAESTKELDEAKIALDDSKKQLDDAKIELDNGKVKLEGAKKEIDENQKLLNEGKIAAGDGEKQLADSKKTLDESKIEMDGYEAEYNADKVKFDDGEAQYNAEKKKSDKELADALTKTEQGQAEIDDAKQLIAESEAELQTTVSDAQIELDAVKVKLEESEIQITASEKEYNDGLIKFDEAVTEADTSIADGQRRIQNGRNDLSEVESGTWYVLNRDDIIVYYPNLSEDIKSIDALAGVFPVFFLMIAALICLSTMTRMIDEQRTQIGTYKALGYSSGSIASKYIIYALTAGISGSILGQFLGVLFLPRAIFGAYEKMYSFPVFVTRMPWVMGLLAFAVSLLCTVAVAWFSCSRELKTITAALMRPRTPKAGKKILLEKIKPLWNLFNFSQKITARNIFRSKVRMLMTIIGITGCMSLVVTGFGLQDSISSIVGKQYGEIDKYDMTIAFTRDYTEEQTKAVLNDFTADDRIESSIFTRIMKATVKSSELNKSVNDISIIVPQSPEQMQKMIFLKDAYSGEDLVLNNNGVIITQKLAETLKLSAGDTFIIENDNKEYTVAVSDIAEYYVLHNIYMTPQLYKEIFNTEIKYNTIFATKSDKLTDADIFKTDLLNKNKDILIISMTEMISDVFDDVVNNMNAVIFIMIVSAGALAFIVMFNLTNINISERVREIATIKVLGFKHFEVDMYIFKENLILSAAGILFGIIGGYYMTKYIVSTIEIEMLMFGRKTELSSYLYAALLTMIFTIFVNIVMSRRMKNISMVESLKAIE